MISRFYIQRLIILILSRIKDRAKKVMHIQSYNEEIKKIAILISSQHNHDFLEMKGVFDKIMQKQVKLPETIRYTIRENFERISNLLTLIFVFSLEISIYGRKNQRQIFAIIKNKKNVYQNIFIWINYLEKDSKQKVVQFILQFYGAFLYKKINLVKGEDISFLITIYSLYEIKRQRNIDKVLSLISSIQQLKVYDSDFQTKEIAILRTVCHILAQSNDSNSNMGLLIDDLLISNPKNIDRFCSYYDYVLAQYPSAAVLKICKGLCRSGLFPNCIELIYNLSKILANYEQFQKLKVLYQAIILPIIIKTGKKCLRDKVQELVFKIARFYIYGFLTCCDIGDKGIDYLLSDVEFIDELFSKKWIQLAFVASEHGNRQHYVISVLQRLKIPNEIIEGSRKNRNKITCDVWQVNNRSISQRKVYIKRQSSYLGIVNNGSQCYIITVVHGLFMTKKLYQLFLQKMEKIDQKRKVTTELKSIFTNLSASNSKEDEKISVDRLQQYGPIQFAESKHQEDAHQYLIALFDQLQSQLKKLGCFKQFKSIFQIEIKETVTCKCGNIINSNQSQYVHTISHLQPIKLKMQEELTDFKCQTCSQKSCKKKIQLNLKGDIFVVHLNRFSVKGGITKKQLATCTIPRKINNYSLVGMIIHIGKNVQCGHYVYYSKIDNKNWVCFNDKIVKQFTLDKEDEEFERQLRQEHTPYILFYKKQRF